MNTSSTTWRAATAHSSTANASRRPSWQTAAKCVSDALNSFTARKRGARPMLRPIPGLPDPVTVHPRRRETRLLNLKDGVRDAQEFFDIILSGPKSAAWLATLARRRGAGDGRRLRTGAAAPESALRRERDRSADFRRRRVVADCRGFARLLDSCAAGDEGRPDGRAQV